MGSEQLQLQTTHVTSGADLSDCGTYRFRLWRVWDLGRGMANFVMLNPSTADAMVDDPTVVRCVRFAKDWGFGGLMVTNLFALRSTDPKALKRHPHPVGDGNDDFLESEARAAGIVVAAWGAHGAIDGRGVEVLGLLSKRNRLHHLGLTKAGHPRHPLYLRRDARPERWDVGGAP